MLAYLLLLTGVAATAQDFSREKEAALGAALAADVRRNSRIVHVPEALEYLQSLAAHLAGDMPGDPLVYRFEIVADNPGSHAPAALPGGYLFVPASLFTAVRSEAEFAGVLAHSMAHAAARHGIRKASNSPGTIPLIFMGGWSGIHGSDAGLLVPAGFLPALRESELEADAIAVRAAAQAGYDPRALLQYIERTQQPDSIRHSPLPPKATRLAALERVIAVLPERPYTAASPRFEQVKSAVTAVSP